MTPMIMRLGCVNGRQMWRGVVPPILTAIVLATGCSERGTDDQMESAGDPDFSLQSADSVVHVTGTMPLSAELVSLGGEGGVAVDQSGTIYVSNFNSSVWTVSPEGHVALLTDRLHTASGNTVLPNGDLLQSDFREHKVVTINRVGELSDFSSEGLNGPVGLARVPSGAVFVANCLGKYVARIDPGGGPAQVFADDERFGCPNGIISDEDGNLYLADLNSPILFKITPNGEVSEHADLGGAGNGHLAMANGFIYVTQLRSHRIVRLSADGRQLVVAGTGERGFANGPEGRSTISFPNGIAVGRSGDILYFNTHRGVMQAGNRGSMVMRYMLLPVSRGP